MYSISKATHHQLSRFLYPKLYAEFRKVIEDARNGGQVGKPEGLKATKTEPAIEVCLKVKKDSLTYWFLDDLLKGDNLRLLLTGEIEYLLNVKKRIDAALKKHPDAIKEEVDQKITKQHIYAKLNNCQPYAMQPDPVKVDVDHFCSILYELFVEKGYEKLLDKKDFVKQKGLRICPYCGRSFIYSVDVNNNCVKPDIDHFFPKSKYPYMALSYYNLIPACNTCNRLHCKDNHEAYDYKNKRFRFPYPYRFKDSEIKFSYKLKNMSYLRDDAFEVKVKYAYKGMTESCRDYLHLDALYAEHRHEAANIYRTLMLLTSKAAWYYTKFNIPPRLLTPTPNLIFGFSFDKNIAPQELLYKFKHDIYCQIMNSVVARRYKQMMILLKKAK